MSACMLKFPQANPQKTLGPRRLAAKSAERFFASDKQYDQIGTRTNYQMH